MNLFKRHVLVSGKNIIVLIESIFMHTHTWRHKYSHLFIIWISKHHLSLFLALSSWRHCFIAIWSHVSCSSIHKKTHTEKHRETKTKTKTKVNCYKIYTNHIIDLYVMKLSRESNIQSIIIFNSYHCCNCFWQQQHNVAWTYMN